MQWIIPRAVEIRAIAFRIRRSEKKEKKDKLLKLHYHFVQGGCYLSGAGSNSRCVVKFFRISSTNCIIPTDLELLASFFKSSSHHDQILKSGTNRKYLGTVTILEEKSFNSTTFRVVKLNSSDRSGQGDHQTMVHSDWKIWHTLCQNFTFPKLFLNST